MITGIYNKRLLKYRARVQELLGEIENEFHADERLTEAQEKRLDDIIIALARASNRILK